MDAALQPQAAQARPDPFSADSRSAMAKMVMNLFDHWQIDSRSQCRLLGLGPDSRGSLARYRRGEPIAPNEDMVDRAGHLLAIHKNLRILYPENREVAYAWMTHENQRFAPTPLSFILDNGFEGLACVRRYLDARRGR
ncbi:MAG: hypothetical protein CMN28_14530 [Salinisphaeraceae bacterium]|nr:hypothetical protein [Salinisphaeraceae bacterium]